MLSEIAYLLTPYIELFDIFGEKINVAKFSPGNITLGYRRVSSTRHLVISSVKATDDDLVVSFVYLLGTVLKSCLERLSVVHIFVSERSVEVFHYEAFTSVISFYCKSSYTFTERSSVS